MLGLLKFVLVFMVGFVVSIIYNNVLLKNAPQVIESNGVTDIEKLGLSIFFTGDVMLGRSVMAKSQEVSDYLYPFRFVADKISIADITVINLENPVIENCPKHTSGFVFCSTPESVWSLVYAGVDIANIANNHISNYGKSGIESTKKYLIDAGVLPVGLGDFQIINKNGIKIGFVGFDFSFSLPKERDYELIYKIAQESDFVVVSVHWGVEYTTIPTRRQKEWAKKLVESGADVIVGHHPHWVQEVEYIEGKPVYYSLGNFIFDQMWSEETKKGIVLELILVDGKIAKEIQYPIYIKDIGQPVFIDN